MKPDPLQAYRTYDVARDIPVEADERIRQRMYAALELPEADRSRDLGVPEDSILQDLATEVANCPTSLSQTALSEAKNDPPGGLRRLVLAAAAIFVVVAGFGISTWLADDELLETGDSTDFEQPPASGGPDVGALGDVCRRHVLDLSKYAPSHGKLERADDPTLPQAFRFLGSMIDGLQAELNDGEIEANAWKSVAASLISTEELLSDQRLSYDAGQTNSVASSLPIVARDLQQIADELAALGISECESPPNS